MSISSNLPPIPLAQAGASLTALAQAAGQVVEARVLGEASGGATQVRVGQQVLDLSLPTRFAPGTTLSFSVQQAEGQLRLTLLAAMPPGTSAGASNKPALAPGAAASPAATLDLSATARAAQQPAAIATPPASAASATAATGAAIVQPTLATVSVPGSVTPPAGSNEPAGPNPVAAQAVRSTGSGPEQGRPAAPQPASGNIATTSGQAIPPQAGSAPSSVAAMGSGAAAAQPNLAERALPYAAMPPSLGAASTPPVGTTPVAEPIISVTAANAAGQQGRPAAPAIAPTAGPAMPAQAALSPQAALAQMVQQALPQQNSVVALTTALGAAMGRVALPQAVVKAAQQVLGQRLALDGETLDGATLQRALRESGILQESLLAAGRPAAAATDMKSALLGLRQSLVSWLGAQAQVDPVAQIAPPWRGVLPRARQGESPVPDLPDGPREIGKLLLERTEGALARLRLHQSASLPDPVTRHDTHLSFDLPVMVGGQQALLQMQIHGDAEGEAGSDSERGWQVRFAINLQGMGEVGAQISLRGKAAGVLLWTEQPETAERLSNDIAALRAELEALNLRPGAVVVRGSAPQMPAGPAPSGHYLDATR